MKNELVLTFEASLLNSIGKFQGLNCNYKPYLSEILTHKHCKFRPRNIVETDFSFKQIIPYIIIRFENKLLYYMRGKTSGEKRLVNNGSIGIGGHISIEDDSLFITNNDKIQTIYNNAVDREVYEEIDLRSIHTDSIIGVLNDDSNDVGKVHFGVVHVWDVAGPYVEKKESKITKLSFISAEELFGKKYNLESWSSICLKYFIGENI